MAAEANVKPWEAMDQTPADILICIEAHSGNQLFFSREYRQITYTIAAANRDPKKSFPKIEQFRPLPGDPGKHKPKEKKSPKEIIAAHRAKARLYDSVRDQSANSAAR